MNLRRFFLEAATLVVAAILCATIANLVASRERKLAFVGSYPNALVVPQRPVESPATAMPAVTSTEMMTTTAAPAGAVSTTTAVSAPVTTAPDPSKTAATTTTTTTPATTTKPRTVASAPTVDDLLARFPVHEKVPFVEISSTDAAWLHERGVLFLDARRTSVYEQGHIAGARSFPVWEADVDARVSELSNEGRDQRLPIVVYCSGGECEDSHMLAQKLWGLFFNNVLVYKDGFPDWQKQGGAIATGGRS